MSILSVNLSGLMLEKGGEFYTPHEVKSLAKLVTVDAKENDDQFRSI